MSSALQSSFTLNAPVNYSFDHKSKINTGSGSQCGRFRTHLEGSFVANLDSGIAAHQVVREDAAGVVDPCEFLGHPEVGVVGLHRAHAAGDAILSLSAFD